MRNINNRMDSRRQDEKAGGRRGSQSIGDATRNVSGWARSLALLAVLLATAGPAMGQFTVQPMKLDFEVTPGKLITSSIDIRNLVEDEAHTIDLVIVDLMQNENAAWEIIEPNSGIDTSKISSLKDSIMLNPSTVQLGAGTTAPVEVRIRVPREMRGFSCAGILATIRPRVGPTENPIVLRFLVPVIVQIAGRPLPHKVRSTDVGMTFQPATVDTDATTKLWMTMENDGQTFPRTRPVARVWSWAGGHWRIITTTGFQDISSDIGIIPGAKLKIETDLKKSLPPGKYKIAAVLYVDGNRTKRVEKEIDFAGDPDIQRVAVDAPLDLDPEETTIESLPGAMRTTVMTVYNGSDETVNVQAALALPRDLAMGVLGDVKGVDMDCTDWIKVEPERFTLRGEGGSQKLRIVATMPETAVSLPCYYTNLNLWASYPDGQSAGLTSAELCVKNTQITVEPKAYAIKLTPHELGGSKYQVVAQFNNYGLTHFTPIRCKATITTAIDRIPRISARLTSQVRGSMLPFEYRNFSGTLDFATVPAGEYRLSAGMEYAKDKWISKQMAIRVTLEGERRVVQTTGTEEDLPEILEVQWSKAPEKAITGNDRG